MRLVYSNQTAQGRDAVTGGLTDLYAPKDSFFYVEHDRRNTLLFLPSPPGRAAPNNT